MTFELFLYSFDTQESQRITKMRVAALRPQWASNEVILLNGVEKLAPTIFRVPLPTAKQILSAQLPSTPGQTVLVEERSLSLAPQSLPESSENDETASVPDNDGLTFVQDKGLVTFHGNPYAVRKVARFKDRLVLSTRRGLPKSRKVQFDEYNHYFTVERDQVDSLQSKHFAHRGIRPVIKTMVERHLDGRPIIDAWVRPDEKEVLVLVNNRLAKNAQKYKDRRVVDMLVYDVDGNEIDVLKKPPIDELDIFLQWVVFLKDGKILFAIGDAPTGPFSLYWYDHIKKEFHSLSDDVAKFRVSEDRSRIAWRKGKDIYQASTGTKEVRQSEGLLDWSGAALAFHFDHDGLLHVFTANQKRWSVQHFDEQGKLKSQKEIPHKKGDRAIYAVMDQKTDQLAIRVRSSEKRGAAEKTHALGWKNAHGHFRQWLKVSEPRISPWVPHVLRDS